MYYHFGSSNILLHRLLRTSGPGRASTRASATKAGSARSPAAVRLEAGGPKGQGSAVLGGERCVDFGLTRRVLTWISMKTDAINRTILL